MEEQRSQNDFDYDDVTIGNALSDAYPRRADDPKEEGLSSSLSLSSMRHDRTGQPVVCTAQKVSKLGFFWYDKGSRFSLTVKQRFENTSSRPILTAEVVRS